MKQEIWAFLLTHYAISAPHVRSGGPGRQKNPDRLSFMRSLRVIRRQVIDQAALSPLPVWRMP